MSGIVDNDNKKTSKNTSEKRLSFVNIIKKRWTVFTAIIKRLRIFTYNQSCCETDNTEI